MKERSDKEGSEGQRPRGNGCPPSRNTAASARAIDWVAEASAAGCQGESINSHDHPEGPEDAGKKGSEIPGQSLTAGKNALLLCQQKEHSGHIAWPARVPIPARVSYALKKTRKTPMPTALAPHVRRTPDAAASGGGASNQPGKGKLNDVEAGEP